MPWCEDCEKYWAPSAMTPEGECPDCGADLEAPERDGSGEGADEEGAPWHFKLLIVLLVVYLVYRGYEMFFA
jgi:hypothetical protein